MIDKVAELSHQLREVGLPVSIRSTHSAAQVYRIWAKMIEIF